MITTDIIDRVLEEVSGSKPIRPGSPGAEIAEAVKESRAFDAMVAGVYGAIRECLEAGFSGTVVIRGVLAAAIVAGYHLGRATAEAESLERLR